MSWLKKQIPPPPKGGGAKKQIPPGKGGGRPTKQIPPRKNPLVPPIIRHAALATLLSLGLAAGIDPGPHLDHAAAQTGPEGWGALAGVTLALVAAVLAGLLRLARAHSDPPSTPQVPFPQPWPPGGPGGPSHTPDTRRAAHPGRPR